MTTEAIYHQTKIFLKRGDITVEEVDVIVNAANSALLGGGGVDGAIHHAGGISILEECKLIRKKEGECPAGHAVMTGAGSLKAKFVIHTVGPVWKGGSHQEADLLRSAYTKSLKLADRKGLKTIAFPSISTGIYGYPIEKASQVALDALRKFLEKEHGLREITFVLFSDNDLGVYQQSFNEVFGLI